MTLNRSIVVAARQGGATLAELAARFERSKRTIQRVLSNGYAAQYHQHDAIIARLVKEGATTPEIAVALGLAAITVNRLRARLGISAKTRRPSPPFCPLFEREPGRPGPSGVVPRDEFARLLRDNCQTTVAALLDISNASVSQRAQRMGLR